MITIHIRASPRERRARIRELAARLCSILTNDRLVGDWRIKIPRRNARRDSGVAGPPHVQLAWKAFRKTQAWYPDQIPGRPSHPYYFYLYERWALAECLLRTGEVQ